MEDLIIKITKDDLIGYINEDEIKDAIHSEIKYKMQTFYKDDVKNFVSNYICVVFKDFLSEVVSEFGEDFYSVFKEKVKERMLKVDSYDIFRHKDSYRDYNSKAVDIMNEVFSDNSFKEEFKNKAKEQMFDKVDGLSYDDFMDMFNYGIVDLLRDNLTKKDKIGVK